MKGVKCHNSALIKKVKKYLKKGLYFFFICARLVFAKQLKFF